MKQQTKLTPKQEQVAEQQTQAQATKEFSTAEEMLRADATQIVVPPEIAERLKKSSAGIAPPAARPWWKNLFGR
jgi:hypothetical protein